MLTANPAIIEKFISLIHEAQGADSDKLKELRKKFLRALGLIGAKQFVNIMADILKDNFNIQGCNDARIPLKSIFNISLDELSDSLSNKDYRLPKGHPLSGLSQDHIDNIKKLKALSDNFSAIQKTDSYDALVRQKKNIEEYFSELDTHIRKEEEVFFPALEEAGMKEHPGVLKEEHEKFRQIFTDIFSFLKIPMQDDFYLIVEKFQKEFIPALCNHVFRETYVFYPAALEFIADKEGWIKIGEGFSRIK